MRAEEPRVDNKTWPLGQSAIIDRYVWYAQGFNMDGINLMDTKDIKDIYIDLKRRSPGRARPSSGRKRCHPCLSTPMPHSSASSAISTPPPRPSTPTPTLGPSPP